MDRWLNSHWFARAVALLLACMLWMVVNLEIESGPTADVNQPMLITGVKLNAWYDDERYEIVRMPKTVKVAVENNSPFYRIISPDSYEVYVDARGKGKGTHRLPVLYKGFPEDAMVEITPSYVDITLEEKQTVEQPVKVEFMGQVAPGYTAGQYIVKPFRVLVTVPESQAQNIGAVKAVVDLKGATEEIKTTVPLKIYDKAGNALSGAEVNPLTVEVTVPVTSPYRVIPLKLNLTNDLPAGYSLASIETSAKEVTVYGPQDVITALETYPGPKIDLSKVKSDGTLQLKIEPIDKVTKVEPENLTVKLKIVPSVTKKLTVPIRVSGLAENLKAKILASDGREITTMEVEVIGAPERLKGLTADDIQVVADVSNANVGVHQIPIIYNLGEPDYLKTSPTIVKQLTVEITGKEQ